MGPSANPYEFHSLLGGVEKTFVVVGTGLSSPNCPTASDLIKESVRDAVASLELPNPVPAPEDSAFDLYDWADRALIHMHSLGISEAESRYRLANALGLLKDVRWFGRAGLPLRGNTPRHRALVRLVLEDRFSAIFCLNWDALLERALESVGLREIRNSEDAPPTGLPGPITAYGRVIHSTHQTRIAKGRVFPLFKPHGCVEELRSSKSQNLVFKITKTDLNVQEPSEQSFLEGRFSSLAGGRPLLGIGWKAGEEYLRQVIKATPPAKSKDAFLLASRSWRSTHDEIAQSRSCDPGMSHARIGGGGEPTTDTLFPWLFSRHTMRMLLNAASSTDRAQIQVINQSLDSNVTISLDDPMIAWCDDWLPAWVRLCWQVGAIRGCDPSTNQELRPHDIPVGPPDLHIPVSGIAVPRKDLEVAARLLVQLDANGHFEYRTFPGALWDKQSRRLIIPLPAWGDLTSFNDLTGLKNLFASLRQHGLGKVQQISLLALTPEDCGAFMGHLREKLSAIVAKHMTHANYARANNFEWLELKDIKGSTYE